MPSAVVVQCECPACTAVSGLQSAVGTAKLGPCVFLWRKQTKLTTSCEFTLHVVLTAPRTACVRRWGGQELLHLCLMSSVSWTAVDLHAYMLPHTALHRLQLSLLSGMGTQQLLRSCCSECSS